MDPATLARLSERENERFIRERPRSAELLERGSRTMPRGVPMSWMHNLYRHEPFFVSHGEGAHFTDVDGHRYFDTNVADMSMFCGYGVPALTEAVTRRMAAGPKFLLPTEDALAVSEELARRWKLPFWQFTLAASSAVTETIRLARVATGRELVLMFAGRYHGHGDDALLAADESGELEYSGLPAGAPGRGRVVQFNDLEAVEAALADERVACVVTEPALTNVGVVLPEPGFHEGLRRVTDDAGTLLVLDETHTLTSGPAGLRGHWGLECDMVAFGKSPGGGVPFGAYGMTESVARHLDYRLADLDTASDMPATGGTLFASALSMAAARATLEEVMTEEAFDRPARLGERLAEGIERCASAAGLPWRAQRLFNRSGYSFAGAHPRNALEAHRDSDPELYNLMRVYMANRGVWEAIDSAGPALSIPAVDGDVDEYLGVLEAFVAEISA